MFVYPQISKCSPHPSSKKLFFAIQTTIENHNQL